MAVPIWDLKILYEQRRAKQVLGTDLDPFLRFGMPFDEHTGHQPLAPPPSSVPSGCIRQVLRVAGSSRGCLAFVALVFRGGFEHKSRRTIGSM